MARRGFVFAALVGVSVGAVFGVSGCGPELDRISALNSLRILGLRKSSPYARPGETVELELFWEDGGPAAPRPVQRFFAFWCVNPPGGLYSACLDGYANTTPSASFGRDRFSFTMPTDALRPSLVDPGAPPSGVAYVFYGVCAGRLSIAGVDVGGLGGAHGEGASLGGASALGGSDGSIPIAGVTELPVCLGEDGEALGADDYVVGYSAVQAYAEFRNENPIVTGFRVNDRDVAVDCIDGDCVGAPFAEPDLTACVPGVACIESCSDDGGIECPKVRIEPIIDEASAEEDSVAAGTYGTDLEESIWVSYFVDRGAVSDDVRLVNDATTGWNANYASHVYAPKKTGPLRIWAVVRDNRGGVAWVRVPAFVE